MHHYVVYVGTLTNRDDLTNHKDICLIRFYSEEEKKRCSEPECSIAGKEVCGLPDIVGQK